jgi:hypothetical protein
MFKGSAPTVRRLVPGLLLAWLLVLCQTGVAQQGGGKYLDAKYCGDTLNLNPGSDFDNGSCQLWKLVSDVDGWSRLQLKHNLKFLDAKYCRDELNLNPGSTYDNGSCQLWKLIPAGDGWSRLQIKRNGKFLEADHCADNVKLNELSIDEDGACQLWRLVPNGDSGWARLQIKYTGGAPPVAAAGGDRKIAFIVVNWAAPAFVREAQALSTQLQKKGWEVHFFDNVEASDGLTISQNANGKRVTYTCVKGKMCGWQKIIGAFLPPDSVRAGDQILIDIQGDGTTNIPNGLKLADGVSTSFSGLSIDMDSVLAYEEFADTFSYKDAAADTWASHSVEAYFQNMKTASTGSDYLQTTYGRSYRNMISAGDAFELSKLYSGRGAKVTIIDHSCNGGSTVRLLETLKDANICAISTTGIVSPGIQGSPPLSRLLSRAAPGSRVSMHDFTRFVSDHYYHDHGLHDIGNRIHQAGFEVSCTSTMAIRETSDNAAGAYSTWWDWNRHRISHVLREPKRYVVVGSASNEQPWTPANLQASFTKDCKLAKKNCDLTTNPRLRIPAGWVRWFSENLEQFKKSHSPSAELNRLVADGNTLLKAIDDYKKAIDSLEAMIAFPQNAVSVKGSAAMPVDQYFRSVFVQRCLCGVSSEVTRLHLTCPAAKDYLPLPKNWSAKSVCADPEKVIDEVLSTIPERVRNGEHAVRIKGGLQALRDVKAFEAQSGSPAFANSVTAKLIKFSRDLEPFEVNCKAASCVSQRF